MFEQLRFLTFGWRDAIEIIVVAYGVYRLLLLLHGTRAVQMLIGIVVLVLDLRAGVGVQVHDDHVSARHRVHVRRVRGARDLRSPSCARRSRTSGSRASRDFSAAWK